jgi:hypothetical protein
MTPFKLSAQDATYLIALLEADRQTALQLLAADHFYQPSLLPRLKHRRRWLPASSSLLVFNEGVRLALKVGMKAPR